MAYFDLTLALVISGAVLLGAVAGAVGVFAVLRRESLLGDVLSHATLPGICLGYLVAGEKSLPVLLAGALGTALVAGAVHRMIVRFAPLKEDTSLGVTLSVFYGLGIVLLTRIQGLAYGTQAGLKTFLFGSAVTMLPSDVAAICVLGLLGAAAVVLFFKEFKLLLFDDQFAATLGYPTRLLDIGLTLLLALVIVTGLRLAGIVLMVAAVVVPAVAARQWSDRLHHVVTLGALIGACSGAAGAFLSALVPWMKTGPAIVVVAATVFVVSLLFSPRKGLVSLWLRRRRMARRIDEDHVLRDLYLAAEEKRSTIVDVSFVDLLGRRGMGPNQLRSVIRRLAKRGLVIESPLGVRLTEEGLARARRIVARHRLWETYLREELRLPSDHVHRDAEEMEHVMDEEMARWLAETLGHPEEDPHGREIPGEAR